ncbi:MAG TPA: glycosyltransferase family 4 protein [Desulfatiglandales bacterium]|nr:glycosyltransferase family 4 protein [Desulfatiglandales bacterium]
MICWIFNQYINTPDTPGGSRHYELAKILVRRGHQIILFGAKSNKNKGLFYREERAGVTIIWFNIKSYYGKSFKRALNMMIYSLSILIFYLIGKRRALKLEIPEVIVGSSVHPFGAYAAYILACLYRISFIFEVRDIWPQTLIDMGALSPRNPFTKAMQFLEKQLYKNSVLIITTLPFAYEYICGRYKVDQEKIKWLPNGVNTDMFPPQDWPREGNFIISYIGTHGIANALDILLDAAEILQLEGIRDIEFRFIGEGPLKSSLIEKVKVRNIKNIAFFDQEPKSDIYSIAQYTSAFIIPIKDLPLYRYGISPNKIYDYMAMERPTIISCSTRNNPIVEAGAGISVTADDPKKIVQAIYKLRYMSKDELVLMGKNGRRFVEEYNDYRVLGIKLEEWLKEIY